MGTATAAPAAQPVASPGLDMAALAAQAAQFLTRAEQDPLAVFDDAVDAAVTARVALERHRADTFTTYGKGRWRTSDDNDLEYLARMAASPQRRISAEPRWRGQSPYSARLKASTCAKVTRLWAERQTLLTQWGDAELAVQQARARVDLGDLPVGAWVSFRPTQRRRSDEWATCEGIIAQVNDATYVVSNLLDSGDPLGTTRLRRFHPWERRVHLLAGPGGGQTLRDARAEHDTAQRAYLDAASAAAAAHNAAYRRWREARDRHERWRRDTDTVQARAVQQAQQEVLTRYAEEVAALAQQYAAAMRTDLACEPPPPGPSPQGQPFDADGVLAAAQNRAQEALNQVTAVYYAR